MEELMHHSIAYKAAIGHINTGLTQYKRIESCENSGTIDFDIFEVLIPAVTNMTLGLELLLKFHHFQVSEKIPRGHDIRKLGSSLPEEKIESLRESYKRLHIDPKVDKGFEVRLSSPKSEKWEKLDLQTYDQAINYIGEMYVEWRYIYEKFGTTAEIAVSFMPIWFVAQAVLDNIHNHKGNVRITF